jgi:hypothetical protein
VRAWSVVSTGVLPRLIYKVLGAAHRGGGIAGKGSRR